MACSKLAERFQLLDHAYAHRGFWAPDGPPENSLAAFSAAATAGLGIELDVRPAVDGTPVCFHDPLLDRTSTGTGLVCGYTAAELKSFTLSNGEPMPSFEDVLAMWPEDLPMLVELKIDGTTDPAGFAQTIASLISDYPGKAAMISFSEAAVDAVPAEIMCGQLLKPTALGNAEGYEERIKQAVARKVDFLALHVTDAHYGTGHGVPVVCWTVSTAKQRQTVHKLGFAEIFEHLPIPLAAR